MEKEIWKDIPGYEGIYMVSDRGRVRSLDRIDCRGHRLKGTMRKPHLYKHGYLALGLKGKTSTVHQLVAIAFLNHIPCGHRLVVDHIDGNKLNNNLNNLQVITNRQNLSRKGGSSKYVGVSWNTSSKRWLAYINIGNGKNKYIGTFEDEVSASEAYQKALTEAEK